MGDRFLHLACQGGNSPLCRQSVTPLLRYIVFTCSKLSHRCRSRQTFGDAKDFCLSFPKLIRKVFVWLTLPKIFLSQRSRRPCFGVTSKIRSSCVFVQMLGTIFGSQTTLGAICAWVVKDFAQLFSVFLECSGILPRFSRTLPRFSGILPGFSTNQNFCRWAWTPCTPPPTPLSCPYSTATRYELVA